MFPGCDPVNACALWRVVCNQDKFFLVYFFAEGLEGLAGLLVRGLEYRVEWCWRSAPPNELHTVQRPDLCVQVHPVAVEKLNDFVWVVVARDA